MARVCAGCPMRNDIGEIQETTATFSPCYHTTPWDVTSPPPECRNAGCSRGLQESAACCCGASDGVQRTNPATADGETCSEARWGFYAQTGASAGSCPECKMGQGADNGIGGRVQETYGDPALIGQPDPQLYGHVYSLDHKLAACSSAVREEFAIMEQIVNEACDVQSYQRLKKCGNCAQAICQFHNILHWISKPSYKCTMVNFRCTFGVSPFPPAFLPLIPLCS
jgi:hypothetical protein